MKRWAKVALSVFALSAAAVGWVAWAASGTAPYAVARTTDAVFQFFGQQSDLHCWTEKADKFGSHLDFIGSRQCYSFGQQKIFRGIYFDEFEGQIFLDGAVPSPRYQPQHAIWLTFDEQTNRSGFPINQARDGITRVWSISFVGRQTKEPGRYGHLGGSEAEIVVDKVLSANLQQSGKGYISCQLIENWCKF